MTDQQTIDPPRETTYQKFVRLLSEAQDAIDDVDDFDLHSDREASKTQWLELLRLQREASVDLVNFVTNNRVDIITAIALMSEPD